MHRAERSRRKVAAKKAAGLPVRVGKNPALKRGISANPSGVSKDGLSHIRGKLKLMTVIYEMMHRAEDGQNYAEMKKVAKVFISQMKKGSFAHVKEYLDRSEGKVPNRIADAEGKKIKLYANMPVNDDDPNAP